MCVRGMRRVGGGAGGVEGGAKCMLVPPKNYGMIAPLSLPTPPLPAPMLVPTLT